MLRRPTSPTPAIARGSSGDSCLYRHADDLATEPHGRAVDDTAGELPAGGIDVIAAGAADGRQHAALQQLVAETLYHDCRRASVVGAGKRVERDEVHLGRVSLEQARQCARLRW